jgi:hypothetical protein
LAGLDDSQASTTNVLRNLKAAKVVSIDDDHPMFLEYDWTSNAYRARLGDALM